MGTLRDELRKQLKKLGMDDELITVLVNDLYMELDNKYIDPVKRDSTFTYRLSTLMAAANMMFQKIAYFADNEWNWKVGIIDVEHYNKRKAEIEMM